ncbi:uncharacterized protein LOC144168073 [Haemaphysalis longicornis]
MYLKVPLPPACDFFIADVTISATQHTLYAPYMANVELQPASQKSQIGRQMAKAPGKGLILMVARNSVRNQPQARPQAIVRGILQVVTDLNADGVGLTDVDLHETSIGEVKADAATLSDEMRDYHGLYRHEKYTGSLKAFKELVSNIAMQPSLVFVYRVTGRAAIFTAPYQTNFYLERSQVEPISEHIKRDVVEALPKTPGRKAVAIAFTLQSRVCPKDTVRNFVTKPSCAQHDSNITVICELHPAYVQSHFNSLMVRRDYKGEDTGIADDVFFEVEATLSRKAKLMVQQLKMAGVAPITVIIERYNLDISAKAKIYNSFSDKFEDCDATPFGFTERTKEQIKNIL